MNNKRNYFIFFALGILVGILICIGFIQYQKNDYKRKLADMNTQLNEESGSAKVLVKHDTVFVKPHHTARKVSKEVVQNSVPVVSDSGKLQKNTADTAIQKQDSARVMADSLKSDSIVRRQKDSVKMSTADTVSKSQVSSQGSDENIVVQKDQLITSLSVKIVDMDKDTISKREQRDDSLLQVVSGIPDQKSSPWYNIEFWHSPVNYRGYKMSKNKILVYGLDPNLKVYLYKLNDVFYLVQGQSVYQLDYTDNFKPYNLVSDKAITSRLLKTK